MSEAMQVEPMPALVTGDRVAWVRKSGVTTIGVSVVHRVYSATKTYCLKDLPDATHRLPPFPSLGECKRCRTLCGRAEKYEQDRTARGGW